MNKHLFQADDPIFEKCFPVRYHELDCHGYLRELALLNYLQDSAGLHAMQLGVSVVDLRPQGLTWVLSRIHLIVERYPRAGDTVLVRTWPSVRQGIFTCREFELEDDQGRLTGRATTSWAVLNTATRRPVRLDAHLPTYPLLARRAVDDDFSTLPPLPDGADIRELPFRVLRGDLDINHHVNNAVYAGWALETVPDEVAANCLAELEITYRAEAFYGESILSRCAVETTDTATCCLHQILNRNDGRELVRLRSRWR
jgi:medium-chain acyl-[acyl-carrier-protein] hydrolase